MRWELVQIIIIFFFHEGADGDDSHGGEDSDVTVDIETCPEEEGERDGRVEGAMSHAPSQDEKVGHRFSKKVIDFFISE